MRRVGAVIALALVAAACGTRVDSDQAAQEAREDARRSGVSLSAGAVSSNELAAGEQAAGVEALEGVTNGATGGGASTGPSGSGGSAATPGAASAGNVAAPAPTGGNGGATDVGVTATEMRLGWVGTLTGPVPGLFRGALIGTQAFLAYQNSQGGLHGRRLKLLTADDGLDSGKNRAGHLGLKDQVFAFVGSFSVNDDGGISVLRDCNCPDIGAALTRAHGELPNTFSPQPQQAGWRSGGLLYFKQRFGQDVIEHTAHFVAAVASARQIAADARKVMESLGYKIVYTREIGPNETNFTGDVIQMRNSGTRALSYSGDVGNMARLAAAMREQNFTVDLVNWGNAIYDNNAFKIAPKQALEGALIDQTYAMFLGEDAGITPEVNTFLQWMKRVDPGQPVDLFAMYGWVSARLFVESMQKVGAQATRAKLLDVLSKTGAWDANGMVAPVNIGQKKPSDCVFIFTIRDGKYVRVFPTDKAYDCTLGPFKYL